MIVVSDTSPIRALAHLGLLDLLRVFDGVLIPPAVVRELDFPTSSLPPIGQLYRPYVRIEESEAMALALERGVKDILLDDRAARELAKPLGLRPIGTLAVLIQAKVQRRIDRVEPLIDNLRDNLNFYISSRLRTEILRQTGELT